MQGFFVLADAINRAGSTEPDKIQAALALPGVAKFVSSQPQYSALWRKPEAEVIPVCEANGIELAVTDDGIGLDPARRRAGLGLRGIEERVRDLGGTTVIQSAAGTGTKITIRLPLSRPALHEEVEFARAAG